MSETIEAHEAASGHDPIYDRLKATPEFQELRRKHSGFVLPATIAFLAWYLLYVVMCMWAPGVMDTKVFGHVNVALIFGLLQFVTTFFLAWRYATFMSAKVDPLARQLEAEYTEELRNR